LLEIKYSNLFKKDIKRNQKRGKNFDKFKDILEYLIANKPLPIKHRDHPLIGNYHKHRECHIEPDWLLIYRIEKGILFLERMGTHADFF
jgi:mRNA interferase YafQ